MNYRNHFTNRAIKAIEFAQYAAQDLEQDYIGTEHILLGLLHEKEGIAAKALGAVGLEFAAVRQQVENVLEQEEQYPSDNPYYTPLAKHAMEMSMREAQRLGNSLTNAPKARGRWGERALQNLLEQFNLGNGGRARKAAKAVRRSKAPAVEHASVGAVESGADDDGEQHGGGDGQLAQACHQLSLLL